MSPNASNSHGHLARKGMPGASVAIYMRIYILYSTIVPTPDPVRLSDRPKPTEVGSCMAHAVVVAVAMAMASAPLVMAMPMRRVVGGLVGLAVWCFSWAAPHGVWRWRGRWQCLAISILWTFKLLLLIISSSFNVATGVGRSSYLCRPLSACRTFSRPVNDVAIASVSWWWCRCWYYAPLSPLSSLHFALLWPLFALFHHFTLYYKSIK